MNFPQVTSTDRHGNGAIERFRGFRVQRREAFHGLGVFGEFWSKTGHGQELYSWQGPMLA
jgi:hypothetical protein